MLNLPASKVTKLHREYWKLRGLHKLDSLYIKTNGNIWLLWKLYKELIEKRGMNIEQVVKAVEIAIHKLPYMENLYRQAKDQAEKMQCTIQRLENDIEAREYKISLLDKIAFACEQECSIKHQEIQELTAEKDRIEKFIANILNREGYSKLRYIVKENVKVVLSENKRLILISFVAIIQTIKTDPQMVKLIQNIPSANDDKPDDNNNSITKFIEVNKDNLLDLAEKHYESLGEALTNNAISTAAASSSNPTLSLRSSSSSTFPNLSNKNDIYRIEEAETYHNSEDDISD